ncbi:MAG: hypothetical protein OXT67_11385 [Zetaproteobacteria bacterium]|nr:hypothetical protein [Zetaproteobacteria bacterium]
MAKLTPNKTKKILNIIYFVDASRTRTIRIPTGVFSALTMIATGLIVWAFVSFFFIGQHVKSERELSQKLRAAMDTIFEYQSRYDGVYEKAYPKSIPRQSVAMSRDVHGSSELVENKPGVQVDVPLLEAEGSSVEEEDKSQRRSAIVLALRGDKPDKEVGVHIEKPVALVAAKLFEVEFGLKNTNSPLKVEGRIYATAFLSDKDGKEYTIYSHRDGGDGAGDSAAWFSIRYFKQKTLKFDVSKVPHPYKLREVVLKFEQGQQSIFQFTLAPLSRVKVKDRFSVRE